jgi:hypothetical protein
MKPGRQLCSRQPAPKLDVESEFLQMLMEEYQEFWGGKLLGPNPPWILLLALHFRLKPMAEHGCMRWGHA